MMFTNEVEKTIYNFIKDSKETVTFELLKKEFGNNAGGTIGKLKQRDLVYIVKEFRTKFEKSIKVIKIKEAEQCPK